MAARSIIPRQGRPFILFTVLVAIAIHYAYGWKWALPVWLLAGVLVYLFRDPSRTIPAIPLAVVSPVDGAVVAVDKVRDPYVEREAIRITLAMRPFDVYFIRSPIEGKVVRSWYVPVRSPSDGQDGAGGEGSRIVMWLRSDEGDDVVLMIISRRFVSPRCYLQLGQRTGQGQRCGYVPFGSRVEVLLPVSIRVRVAVDDVVRAGSDVIATLVHK